jgi:hypothetical protein
MGVIGAGALCGVGEAGVFAGEAKDLGFEFGGSRHVEKKVLIAKVR